MISLKWELDSSSPGDLRIWEDNGVKRCYKTPVAMIPQRSGHPMQSHPETDAIAALVLAAPAMYEALVGLFAECAMTHKTWGDGNNRQAAYEAMKAANDAIALAENHKEVTHGTND